MTNKLTVIQEKLNTLRETFTEQKEIDAITALNVAIERLKTYEIVTGDILNTELHDFVVKVRALPGAQATPIIKCLYGYGVDVLNFFDEEHS